MNKNIRKKLTTTNLLLICAVVLLSCLLLGFAFNKSNEEIYVQNLLNQSYIIDQMLTTEMMSKDQAELKTLMQGFAKKLGSRITIFDLAGNVLVDSQADEGSSENHSTRPEVISALAEGEGRDIRINSSTGTEYLYVARRNTGGTKLLGIIQMSLPMSKVRTIPNVSLEAMLLSLILAGALAVISSFYFAKKITVPLAELTKAAQKIAKGDYAVGIQAERDDEIGELEQAIQAMASSLQQSRATSQFGKERIEKMLAYLVSGVILIDSQGDIDEINIKAEQILGLRAGQAKGKSFLYAFREPQIEEVLQEVVQTKKLITMEYKTQRDDKYYLLYFVPLPLEQEGQEVLLMLHDITELKQVELMRTEFVANASHEFKTPLTAIKGFSEALLEGAADNPATRARFLGIILSETERLHRLIEDLLNLARIEGAEQYFTKTEVDLAKLLTRAVESFLVSSKAAGIAIKQELATELPILWAEEDWLYQVFLNLIDNALKYSEAGSTITIKAKQLEQELYVEVEDQGVGIPPESLNRIFERFYRVDKARSRAVDGTGLGLAIVKHVVESHGGKLGIKSKIGIGTTIWFTLPLGKK